MWEEGKKGRNKKGEQVPIYYTLIILFISS